MIFLIIAVCLLFGGIIGYNIGKSQKSFSPEKVAINSYWIDKGKEDEIIQILDVDLAEHRIEGRYFRHAGKNLQLPGTIFNLSVSSLVMKYRKIPTSEYSTYGIDSSSTYWRI